MGNDPSKKASGEPGGGGGASPKEQQIASLMRRFPLARKEPAAQGHDVYDLGVRVADGQVVTLRILMGPLFPQQPPQLTVLPPGRHRWLDPQGNIVNMADLGVGQWTMRTDIGRVVYDVMQEFTANPKTNTALGRVGR